MSTTTTLCSEPRRRVTWAEQLEDIFEIPPRMDWIDDLKMRTGAALGRVRDPKSLSRNVMSYFKPKSKKLHSQTLQSMKPRPVHQPVSILKQRKPYTVPECDSPQPEAIIPTGETRHPMSLRLSELWTSFSFELESITGERYDEFNAICKDAGDRLLWGLGYPIEFFREKYPEVFENQSSASSSRSSTLVGSSISTTPKDESPWWLEDEKVFDGFYAPIRSESPISQDSGEDGCQEASVAVYDDDRLEKNADSPCLERQAMLEPLDHYFPFDRSLFEFELFQPEPSQMELVLRPTNHEDAAKRKSKSSTVTHTAIAFTKEFVRTLIFLYLLWIARRWLLIPVKLPLYTLRYACRL
ncbi:hypothetical protein BOTBODRAFT_43454 [Botryobasidium botryosum FD-172 SS1]|uniref:Uncharacterized protein n=1 Tax=Botryobasidium botryosum (strain FD-172 SS1) TaxID=930990 RepID=A0A067MP93_BOTB1|nr:hypothetical protein BOTBODRAFT_43454 [Botryobasidium botryosum FD-172 SS1]